jgi:glc operon protein GlcG
MTRSRRLLFATGLVMGLGFAFAWSGLTSGARPVAAQAAPPAAVAAQPIDPAAPLSRAEARAIVEGAISRAQARNQRMGVAVVDEGGHVISQDRMDGASFNSVVYATGKAFAAVMQRAKTAELATLLQTRPDRYYGIIAMWPGQVYLVQGGQPLTVNGRVVGAVGVAGLPQGEDDEAGQVGIAAWRQMRPGAGE